METGDRRAFRAGAGLRLILPALYLGASAAAPAATRHWAWAESDNPWIGPFNLLIDAVGSGRAPAGTIVSGPGIVYFCALSLLALPALFGLSSRSWKVRLSAGIGLALVWAISDLSAWLATIPLE